MKLTYIHTAIVGVMSLALHPSYLAAQPIAQLISNDGHEQIVIQNIPKPPTFIAPIRNKVKTVNIHQVRKPLPVIKEKTPVKQRAEYLSKQGGDTPKGFQDLPSQAKPLPPIRTDLPTRAKSEPSQQKKLPPKSVKAAIEPSFYVTQGQTYLNALTRWISDSGYKRVAWALPNDLISKLNIASNNGEKFTGKLPSVIYQLGKQMGYPHLRFDSNHHGLAAIHTIRSTVDIHWIHEKTLKASIQGLTRAYGWHWVDNPTQKSWLIPSDKVYYLGGSYPIVVPRGDFAAAINTVIDGYPIQAQLDNGTQTIYVVEK
ncbi:hypothetical protein QMU85_002066 [Photobacterium damselae]|nr:hypothetical protein [Photobacterium damselae]